MLKEYVKQDKSTRAGIEVAGGKGKIFVTGEVTSGAKINVKQVVKRVLKSVGYSTQYKIINNIGMQSKDIAQGVDTGGAGDQGMMFGYACNDTPQKLPLAMIILQEFAKWYDELRQHDKRFLSDGKAQITGKYDENFRLLKIKVFTVSYQNTETNRKETDNIIVSHIKDLCYSFGIDEVEDIHINPTGKFLIGGFDGDSGLTGRKIVVDAYQSFANVGGGCMNGKDASKVDFSASHKARQIACDYLTNHNLYWCEVQLSYSIGINKPLAIYINSNKGSFTPNDALYDQCTPKKIIQDLKMTDMDYEQLAKFGHFS